MDEGGQVKRAIVTGAGKRLGRAMALYLGGRGYDVAVHYSRSGAAAQEVAAEIRAMGQRAETVQADLIVEAQMQALLPAATEALGGPFDLLVNNASIFEFDSISGATRESWDRHIESNLRAPFVLTQAFAAQAPEPGKDARGETIARALIVNMIDQRVKKLTPAFASYTIAKMGLWAMTQTTARALAPAIRVNAIGPGPTLKGANQPPEQFEKQRAASILERGSNPEDVTAALGYFIDAPGVTGQLICTDGGQHLGWKTPDIVGLE